MKQTGKETAVITTTARVTAARLEIREARPRRLTSTLLWAAQILLAAFFVFIAALPKLIGSHAAVQEFGLIGAGQWFRYLVGTVELAVAITAPPAGIGAAVLPARGRRDSMCCRRCSTSRGRAAGSRRALRVARGEATGRAQPAARGR